MGPHPVVVQPPGLDSSGGIRQDLIAKEFAPSLGYRLGMPRSLDCWLPNLLPIHFDLLAWSLRRSGLITVDADRP